MRRAAKVDLSHKEIVKGLRQIGRRVFDTSAHGDGFPDMVVPLRNGRVALLFEIKNESGGKVTKEECTFMMQIVEPLYRMVDSLEQVNSILEHVELD
jgi:Holliday junction resolvase